LANEEGNQLHRQQRKHTTGLEKNPAFKPPRKQPLVFHYPNFRHQPEDDPRRQVEAE